MTAKPSELFILCLLGALSVISPFAIDMYLPAFLQIAHDFAVPTSKVSLTLSSYFIGLAAGQVFYGPLLDRFGRKIPLCIGLLVFIAASVGCALTTNIDMLIVCRFIQALGGCGAQVASLAMVRDFFKVEDTARILSRLFLFILISPLLAPSIGGFIVVTFGWRAVFAGMMALVAAILALTWFLLPEAHKPDRDIILRPGPILGEYLTILKYPAFSTYAFAGAFSFAGLFTYVAGSPIIFMEGFHLSAKMYSGVFAILALGFFVSSQFNVRLLRKFESKQLFACVLAIQVIANLVFVTGSWFGWWGLYSTMFLFFVTLACAGIAYPNAAALAMTPFSKNAGSAAALLGCIQLGLGAVISSSIGMLTGHDSLPIIIILAVTSSLGLMIAHIGAKRVAAAPAIE